MPSASALAALAFVGLLAALSRAPVRDALRNGLRCLARYGDFWRIPALFGMSYALFQLAATALLHFRLGEPFPLFSWTGELSLEALVATAWPTAAERSVATFTIFSATFPLSAWFALLFLFNAGGVLAELAKSLRKRFGPARGIILGLALVLAAVAAVIKPAAYLCLPEAAAAGWLLPAMGIDALSCAFELALGIFFLSYLMLMADAWLRGLRFDRGRLRRLTMQRTGFVLRWSLLVVALTGVFIWLPAHLALYIDPADPWQEQCLWFSTRIGRPFVTLLTLLWLPAPIILVFHNLSLRRALGDGRRLLRSDWSLVLPFFLTVASAFLGLELVLEYVGARLGGETVAALGLRCIGAGIEGCLAGWLIASWVCLYKGFSPGRKEVLF